MIFFIAIWLACQNEKQTNVTYSWDILQFGLKKSLELDFKNTLTTLLDSDWFYNMLGLAMKNIWITLMDLDRFYDVLDLDLK